MKNIVRLKNIDINNIKNVKHGQLKTSTDFEYMNNADIIGFYGQNGSGKTALVEAFSILKKLLNSTVLPKETQHLLLQGQKFIELKFEFCILNSFGEFSVKYESKLEISNGMLKIESEKIAFKENEPNKRYKNIIEKNKNNIKIRTKDIKSVSENLRLKIMLSNEMALVNSTGFIFREELQSVLEKELSKEEYMIIKNLAIDFNKDYHVIDNEQNGLILANIIMPFSIHLDDVRRKISYGLKEPMLLLESDFKIITKVIEQINLVIKRLIPDLEVVINPIHKETMKDGKDGIRFEFLSKKNEVTLPLYCESAGILKLISILSTLIAVYNNPNACVVIDELDSGIFEYLLGEIIELIDGNGKGQLFFTSHNLRILEVVNSKNLWFTTMNEENRFIQLKGIKKLSNARDVYLRAVQLGGQDEELYKETDFYDIKKAFRKAGAFNV